MKITHPSVKKGRTSKAGACLWLAALAGAGCLTLPIGAETREPAAAPNAAPVGAGEALARAQLLHTVVNGALQVMHRDFFRRGGIKAIPSKSLDDVFKVMEEEKAVTLRWLAADGTAMNKDNKARDDFERKAIAAISGGEKEVTSLKAGTFRYAGAITLQNECLKCHAPDRTSLEDRFAALVVIMPAAAAK